MADDSRMAMIGSPLRVDGIEKRYGDTTAVARLSFEAAPGEFLALLGPSGSGKTSVLMMIAGFEAPSRGELEIGGQNVTALAPNRRGLGVVFQHYTLFPHMSVRDNVSFPLRMRGLRRKERADRAEEALRLVQLGGYGDRLPGQHSGGQQQRVAIARAIVFRPRLLLMDEPLGALDRRLREDMQIEIKRLHAQLGLTVIYVTHDQEEALSMADRVAVMRAGRLEQIGTPRDLYERPANPFVANFLGHMNFIHGTAGADGGRPVLHLGTGQSVDLTGAAGLEKPMPAGEISLGVRPENVRLQTEGSDASASLCGTVTAAAYVGSSLIIHVDLGGGTAVRARIPASRASRSWQTGVRVQVSWDPGDATLFPEGPDSGPHSTAHQGRMTSER